MDQRVEEALRPTVAVVNGAPLTDLPDDLYIPPDALRVFLETFEGPLDLLLYLIRKQNLDILDIPVAEITRQYVGYIEMMQTLRMELAADYLVMGAILAEIKSRMLLPQPAADNGEEEDPRATLIRRLQEYERFKLAAETLEQLPRLERDHFEVATDTSSIPVRRIHPEVDLSELLSSFKDILQRLDRQKHHTIKREPLSVRERMSQILQRLQHEASAQFCDLFSLNEGRAGAIVAFLAVLELSKQGLIELLQNEPPCLLSVRLATAG